MITIEEAKKIIEEAVPKGEVIVSTIEKSLRRVIAKDILAPFDLPLFSASAMDGYAVRDEDTRVASSEKPLELRVASHLFAGDSPKVSLHSGEAIQIMTGAMIPPGTTAVIPQEEVKKTSSHKIFISRPLKKGENIRSQGEEIKKGEMAVPSFAIVTPALVGHLTALGIYKIPIFRDPTIAILPSGSELVRDAREIRPGKIFDSNSYTLTALLKQMGLLPRVLPPIADDKELLKKTIRRSLENHDVTIISGGVSVGEKDYIREILGELQVDTLFWKVAQKPGKPLFMGKRRNRLVFGLPGNPAAALVCFYEYVKPTLLKWLGHTNIWPVSDRATLKNPLSKQGGRTHFLRARASREEKNLWVAPMDSFVRANCLAIFPKERSTLKKGEDLEIHWIDGREDI